MNIIKNLNAKFFCMICQRMLILYFFDCSIIIAQQATISSLLNSIPVATTNKKPKASLVTILPKTSMPPQAVTIADQPLLQNFLKQLDAQNNNKSYQEGLTIIQDQSLHREYQELIEDINLFFLDYDAQVLAKISRVVDSYNTISLSTLLHNVATSSGSSHASKTFIVPTISSVLQIATTLQRKAVAQPVVHPESVSKLLKIQQQALPKIQPIHETSIGSVISSVDESKPLVESSLPSQASIVNLLQPKSTMSSSVPRTKTKKSQPVFSRIIPGE